MTALSRTGTKVLLCDGIPGWRLGCPGPSAFDERIQVVKIASGLEVRAKTAATHGLNAGESEIDG